MKVILTVKMLPESSEEVRSGDFAREVMDACQYFNKLAEENSFGPDAKVRYLVSGGKEQHGEEEPSKEAPAAQPAEIGPNAADYTG